MCLPGRVIKAVLSEDEQLQLLITMRQQVPLWKDEAFNSKPFRLEESNRIEASELILQGGGETIEAESTLSDTPDAAAPLTAKHETEATQRSLENDSLKHLRAQQVDERDRHYEYQKDRERLMRARHDEERKGVLNVHARLEQGMQERHSKAVNDLEDHHVSAEMELRENLDQQQRSCLVRLRHMEAYCHGMNDAGTLPSRTVTERDIHELQQQYKVRDGMENVHQSRINVLREKQAQQLDALNVKQKEEGETLLVQSKLEFEMLEARFAAEEAEFAALYKERRHRLELRWAIDEKLARLKLAKDQSTQFGALPPIEWPREIDHSLQIVDALQQA
ncbi:MAG: hypothetical protein M1819_006337 [Sarea resinae]|nr:MAG: hypothetical protein M1819_006337 [Sarea resinae]